MHVMNWNLKQPCLERSLSLTDVRKKLFPEGKLNRAPVLSEEKYTSKTLEGNWFERRAVCVPLSDDWRTSYEVDYKHYINKTLKKDNDTKWNNSLKLEGLAQEELLNYRKEYRSNMTTSYDLNYNILPKGLQGPKLRSYNARKRKWIPELDLTNSYGTLTQFGLKEMLKDKAYRNSQEGIAKCRWQTTYREEIAKLKPINNEYDNQFHRRIVNFNVPDLKHFERKLSNTDNCLFL